MIRSIRIVHIASDFRKAFPKLLSHIQDLAIKKDQLFRDNTFTPSLQTHKLKGPLGGYWAYSLSGIIVFCSDLLMPMR